MENWEWKKRRPAIVKAATLDTGYVRSLEEEKSVEAEGRLLNIEELVTAAVEAEEQGETLQDFIDHAALVADTDQYKADARVTLMTMHSAKGLEFPVVVLAGWGAGALGRARHPSDYLLMEKLRAMIDAGQLKQLRSRAGELDVMLEVHGSDPYRAAYETTLRQSAALGVKTVGCYCGMLMRPDKAPTLEAWDAEAVAADELGPCTLPARAAEVLERADIAVVGEDDAGARITSWSEAVSPTTSCASNGRR